MRGYVSSHGSSMSFKDEENTMKKNYFAEGSCHGHTFDDVPVQPHTLVSLKNQQYCTWNVGSIITFNSILFISYFHESILKMVYNKEYWHCSWIVCITDALCLFYFDSYLARYAIWAPQIISVNINVMDTKRWTLHCGQFMWKVDKGAQKLWI